MCTRCSKATTRENVSLESQGYVCKLCKPEVLRYKCFVCKELKEDFPSAYQLREDAGIRRCQDCCTCRQCKGYFSVSKMLDNEPYCRQCHKKLNTKQRCDVCLKDLLRGAFAESQLHNYPDRNVTLRCKECHKCEACGQRLHPKSFEKEASTCKQCLQRYSCNICEKDLPRSAFSDSQLHNYPHRQKNLQCEACVRAQKTYKCDACKKKVLVTEFDPGILRNALYHDRHAVCKLCQDNGFSPKDVDTYTCVTCGNHGHGKFPTVALHKWKHGKSQQPLLCKDCQARKQAIQKKLDNPAAWKCTCPGKGKERQHIWSNEKCQLYPTQAGQKRWPGQNVEVSEADDEFVQKIKRHKSGR